VIVAEQVAAALEGGLVTNAVNIPSIGAEDLEVLGPFIPLAAKLGRLAMELAAAARADRARVLRRARRYDTRLLTVAALNGAFQGRADQPVNYVNAPLIAAERGIEVVEERRRPRATSRTSSASVADGDELRVAGTTIGATNRRWLVSALGFELEMELAPLMVVFRYDDVPGVIGRVGTLFGEAGVNIANMAVSRDRGRQGADGALARHDRAAELVERLREGCDDAHCVRRHVARGERGSSERALARAGRARVARSCAVGREARIEEFARDADARRRGRARRLRARADRQVARLRLRRRGRRARARRPARRRRKIARAAGARRRDRAPREVRAATGFAPGASRRSRSRTSPRARSSGRCSRTSACGSAPAPTPHGGARAGELVRLAGRAVDAVDRRRKPDI
jgi:hypothetical protein